MSDARYRPVYLAALVLAAVWGLAWGGFRLAERARPTAEKVTARAGSLDLARLTAEQRARALQELASQLNRLDWEERRQVRMGRSLPRLFAQMTEREQESFIERTLPTGFKQMLASFEQLPEERRRRALTNAVDRMRRERDGEALPGAPTNNAPVLSPELQKKVVTLGLRTFYNESSAQTKAELAPVLEELQRQMEGGRLLLLGPR